MMNPPSQPKKMAPRPLTKAEAETARALIASQGWARFRNEEAKATFEVTARIEDGVLVHSITGDLVEVLDE